MNENGVRISYERLFNMGNFEHEKYTISKDVDLDTELEAFKILSLKIVDFEADLNKYRKLCDKLPSLQWATKHEPLTSAKEKAEKELEIVQHKIQAFREEHKPVFKPCKCYYCTHDPNDDYNEDEE